MELDLTRKQFRRLLDMVYIGNWILNSTLGEWGNYLVEKCNAIPITNDPSVKWPAMIADASHIYDGITNRWTAQTAFALNNDLLPTVKSALTKLMGGACTAEEFIAEIQAYYNK